MKHLILLLIILFRTITTSAQDQVTFKLAFSEPYNTYDFLTRISANYPDNELKTIFLKSIYNTPSIKGKLAQFEKIRIDYTYAFTQYPQPLKVGLMSRDVLERNLATNKTVTEFMNSSLGIIPNEDLFLLGALIEHFIPIYRELIFKPNQAAFAKQKENLTAYVNNNRFSSFFKVGLAFYHTEWNAHVPFELCLLPSLEKNSLGARAFMNVAICEASLDLKDNKALFSVAMHEIYHILYDNQSLQTKNELKQWFDNTKSTNSQYALLLLNEVLATALGNAYVMEQLNGKIEAHDWYDNKYITAMAKEIYPLVKSYIEHKRPLDEDFVKAYVAKYDTQFPAWAKELDHLMAYRYIVADEASDLSYFRKNYRKYSNQRLGSPISIAEIEKMKDLPVTRVVIVAKNHQQTLKIVKNSFAALKDVKFNYETEFVQVFHLNDNTKLLLINRVTSTMEELMNTAFPDKIIK